MSGFFLGKSGSDILKETPSFPLSTTKKIRISDREEDDSVKRAVQEYIQQIIYGKYTICF